MIFGQMPRLEQDAAYGSPALCRSAAWRRQRRPAPRQTQAGSCSSSSSNGSSSSSSSNVGNGSSSRGGGMAEGGSNNSSSSRAAGQRCLKGCLATALPLGVCLVW